MKHEPELLFGCAICGSFSEVLMVMIRQCNASVHFNDLFIWRYSVMLWKATTSFGMSSWGEIQPIFHDLSY